MNNVRHIEAYLSIFEYMSTDSGMFRNLVQLDLFMYIKAYLQPMAYSGIFRTITQEQFMQILNLIQADSGIFRTLAYLGTQCFTHIQAYSRSYILDYSY